VGQKQMAGVRILFSGSFSRTLFLARAGQMAGVRIALPSALPSDSNYSCHLPVPSKNDKQRE